MTLTEGRYGPPFEQGSRTVVRCTDCSSRSTVVAVQTTDLGRHEAMHTVYWPDEGTPSFVSTKDGADGTWQPICEHDGCKRPLTRGHETWSCPVPGHPRVVLDGSDWPDYDEDAERGEAIFDAAVRGDADEVWDLVGDRDISEFM